MKKRPQRCHYTASENFKTFCFLNHVVYKWLTEFLESCWNRKALSCSWSECALPLGLNRVFDPPSFASVRHLIKTLSRACHSMYCRSWYELLLPMVFNEEISGDWCWFRWKIGNTTVNEESSLSWIRTDVRCLEVQQVSKVEDTGGHLTCPVIFVQTWTSVHAH